MKVIFTSVLALFFTLFLIYSDSYAQNSQKLLKNLSEKSDLIIEGKVIRQNSAWNNDKTRIYTEVTVEVDEYLKGNDGKKSIVVTTPGGEVGEVGELYSHMPRFSKDESVLLFVKREGKNMNYKVLNGEDGKLTLYNDKKTGEKVTSSNKKVSALKKEIKDYIDKRPQE